MRRTSFSSADGLEAVQVVVEEEEEEELGGILVQQDVFVGAQAVEEAVAAAVAAGGGFAFSGFGACRFFGVLAVGVDLGLGGCARLISVFHIRI